MSTDTHTAPVIAGSETRITAEAVVSEPRVEFGFTEKPIQIARGDGVHPNGNDGTEYLDFGVSCACVPLGHCHLDVVGAIREQAT